MIKASLQSVICSNATCLKSFLKSNVYKPVTTSSSFFNCLTVHVPLSSDSCHTCFSGESQLADHAANSLWVCRASQPTRARAPLFWGDDAHNTHVFRGAPEPFICVVSDLHRRIECWTCCKETEPRAPTGCYASFLHPGLSCGNTG